VGEVLWAEGELGLPTGLNTAPMPWWVNALFMTAVLGVNAFILLQVRRADIRKINTDIDLKLEESRVAAALALETAKRDEDNSALAQWKAIARNEIKLRGEAEEWHRKRQLDTEEANNKKMSDLVGATRAEVHELRNEMGTRITRADAEIAELRTKEWECQKRMARFEGIARAKGWDIARDETDRDPDPPPPEAE
jgi:hypothetical protein